MIFSFNTENHKDRNKTFKRQAKYIEKTSPCIIPIFFCPALVNLFSW